MQPYFFIEADKRFVKICFSEIIYIEACRNYVRIVTSKALPYMALMTLRQLETMLPPERFCRIHRSYIVSIDSIQSFVRDRVYIQDNKVLPIGVSYSKALQQRITIITNDYYIKDYKVLETIITNTN